MKTMALLLPLITITVFMMFLVLFSVNKSKSRKQNNDSGQVNNQYRLLCKSQSNRIFAGVCGGIAEYFRWNATIVRLFFLFSGIGIFTYVIMALVIPESDSPLF